MDDYKKSLVRMSSILLNFYRYLANFKIFFFEEKLSAELSTRVSTLEDQQ